MKKDFFNKFATAALSKEMSAKLVGGAQCQVIDCGGPCTRTGEGSSAKECCSNGACWTPQKQVAISDDNISSFGM